MPRRQRHRHGFEQELQPDCPSVAPTALRGARAGSRRPPRRLPLAGRHLGHHAADRRRDSPIPEAELGSPQARLARRHPRPFDVEITARRLELLGGDNAVRRESPTPRHRALSERQAGAIEIQIRPRQINGRLERRHVEHRQQLPGLDPVPDLHRQLGHRARDPRAHLDLRAHHRPDHTGRDHRLIERLARHPSGVAGH